KRDSAFIVFRDMISAFSKTDIVAEREAYNEIWPVIVKLGTTMYAEGYLEQSSRLKTLFRELEKPEKANAIEILGVSVRLEKLKMAEENFTSVYDSRMEEETKKDYPTIREARTELSPLINDLLPTLRMVASTSPENADLSWIDLINEQTSLVMTQIAARRTRKDNQNSQDSEDTAS
ncbi:MAG: DUF6261 family protein, partial [Cyclobacteriaceae bacterium]